jgi:prolyl-tRNA editing enzyme YbaK/EbsC (Cys-tRNA(Pro) deacylase)
MLETFPEDVNRVRDFLRSKNSKSVVQMLPESTATAQEAADTLSVALYQIGKSIVLGNESQTIVAIVCGDQKVDVNALSKEINIAELKPLKADDVKKRVGFVIGGVSPFSLPTSTIIIVDSRLHNLGECYVAAGHPKAVIKTSGKEIVDLTGATVSLICVQ